MKDTDMVMVAGNVFKKVSELGQLDRILLFALVHDGVNVSHECINDLVPVSDGVLSIMLKGKFKGEDK